ncbi:FISUMP domain-containing protein [Marinifilum sp. RC60d5]|uniref:FISUMP domain-containing protein n=1 Tax=Marinifilum sp. RC60d5 TaxID=3458414 RepID=UPI004035BA37
MGTLNENYKTVIFDIYYLLVKKLRFPLLTIMFSILFYSCDDSNNNEDNELKYDVNCKITSPSEGTILNVNETIVIKTSAECEEDPIMELQLYIDNIANKSNSSFPYDFEWTPSSEDIGTHILKVKALNINGDHAEDEVSISVDQNCGVDESEYGSFIDSRDNKRYKTIKIGNQEWMAENLAYMPYISATGNGGIRVYNFNGSDVTEAKKHENYIKYGCLYDWFVAQTISPEGWRLPLKSDYDELISFLGNSGVAGGHLKDICSQLWVDPNIADNSSGFLALPGGGFSTNSVYFDLGLEARFWSSHNISSNLAWYLRIHNNTAQCYFINEYKKYCFSVRCIKE